MAAATALLVGSTVLGAGNALYGADTQAKALRAQGRYQQQIAETNARRLEMAGEDVLERGQTESSLVRRKASRLRSSQRAGYAGQGVDVNRGTALQVQDETYAMGEMDALTVKNNAWREAWGFKTQAADTRSQGRLAAMTSRLQAKNTMLTGGLSAFGTLMKGGYYLTR